MQLQCDKCDCWQHVDCIDLNETSRQHIEYKNKPFFCLICANDALSLLSVYSYIGIETIYYINSIEYSYSN